VSHARFLATYAENPARWQADPCVQMYGQLLAVRDAQQGAFLVAAETLRAQTNLPRDLRASASRTRASVLFQKAAKMFETLQISLDGPWPRETFEETLKATAAACEAYLEALAESADPQLCKEVEPHCPEWPAAIDAVRSAYTEVLKLRAELRFRQIRWHSQQAEHARVVSEAARRGGTNDEASKAVDALQGAGLLPTTQEQELWQLAADACDRLVEECVLIEPARSTHVVADSAVTALRSRGQALQALTLKDLAIAHAMAHDLETAVENILKALRVRVGNPSMLTQNAADQIQAAAKGVLELCGRQLHSAETQAVGKAASSRAAEVAEAIAVFDAWRKGE